MENRKRVLIIFTVISACILIVIGVFFLFQDRFVDPVELANVDPSALKDSFEASARREPIEQVTTDDGPTRVEHPKYGFSVIMPGDRLKNYYEEVSEMYLFCEAEGPGSMLDLGTNQKIKFGCLEAHVLNNAMNLTLDEFADKMHVDDASKSFAIDGREIKLHSKKKVMLGDNEFYKINYRDNDVGGSYHYITMLKSNKPLELVYFYDDFSKKNSVLIPIYEEMLGTFEE